MMTITDTKSKHRPGEKPEYWCDECGQPASFIITEMGRAHHFCGFVDGEPACTASERNSS